MYKIDNVYLKYNLDSGSNNILEINDFKNK